MTRLGLLRPRVAGFFAFRVKPGHGPLVRAAAAAAEGLGWKVLGGEGLRGVLKGCVPDAALARRASLLVSLGGDGTLLGLAALAAPLKRPVLGLNLGGLGYITALGPDGLAEGLARVLGGRCRLERRRLIRVEVLRRGARVLRVDALNDVVLARPKVGRLASLTACVDGNFLADFRSDGLIYATPTGSTAYNLSVGGPLVDPAAPVFILALISPHTLGNRPLVLPDDRILELDLHGDLDLATDGRNARGLKAGDRVRLSRCPHNVDLVFDPDREPWAVLRDKLGWLGSARVALAPEAGGA